MMMCKLWQTLTCWYYIKIYVLTIVNETAAAGDYDVHELFIEKYLL